MRTRHIERPVPWLVLAGWSVAAVVSAAQPGVNLDQRYPKGTITSESVAERALIDAEAAQKALDAQYRAESARCARVFLATHCQNEARRAHTIDQEKVRRVEVEAHDLQRQLAAQQRASRRDEEQAQQRKEEAERPEKERQGQNAAQKRVDQTQERAQDALRQQAQSAASRDRFEKRNVEHESEQAKRADVQIRNSPENARRYKEKQARAKAYAADRARERDENQKVRAERERKRKAQVAQEESDPAVEPKR
jgi:colicin import membrane protein